MLGNKAKPRRLNSKGNLNGGNSSNINTSNSNTLFSLSTRSLNLDTVASRFGRALYKSIPVLSIFALVGITINAAILLSSSSTAGTVYAAEEVIGDSTASITISGAGSNEQVEAGYSEVSYRTHTVRLQASNAKDYSLLISGPSTLITKNKDGSTISGVTPTTISSANGVTGTTMASDSSKSNIWGYGWGDTNTSSEELVYTAPSAAGTALAAGSIDNTAHNLDVTKKLAFAIKFGEDALPGRYTDTVRLQLVVTPRTLTTYSITYNANGGSNAPTTQSIESYEESYSFTIPNTTPTRSGYDFLGWSTSSNASVADSNYAIGKTVTLTVGNPSRVLYAVWEEEGYNYQVIYNCNSGSGCPSNLNIKNPNSTYSYTIPTTKPTRNGYSFLGYATTNATIEDRSYALGTTFSLTSSDSSKTLYAIWKPIISWNSITEMQQMTPEACAATSVGSSKTVTDSRDSNSYIIQKLTDGNCWMTQNLRLIGKRTLQPETSDLETNFELPASSSAFNNDIANKAVYYGSNTTYGAYYTWCSATAGTCTDAVTNGANATSSICPRGWKLPVSGLGTTGINTGAITDQRNDFMTLAGKTSTEMFLNTSTSIGGTTFPYSGYIGNYGNQIVVGDRGFYWSRTASSAKGVYYLDVYRSPLYVIPACNYEYRHFGFNIRCIAYSN